MSFLVLILTILLEKLSHWRQMLQKDQWWYEQLQRCHKLLSKQHTLALLLALSLPLIALALVLVSLKSVAYGLLLLPVHLIVLMYSLSRGDVRVALGPFTDAWRRQDTQAASLAAQRDLLIQSEEPAGLLQAVQGHLLWQGFQGFFAVIFYYIIAGPIAALFYRLLVLTSEQSNWPQAAGKATRILHALNWIPVRILSLSFALLGNFITVSRTLTPDLLCITEPADNLISKTGRAAVEAENNALGIQGTDTLNDIWLLLIRSAVLWIAFLAFWTLFF
ncbi:regulatory signaling modulator protein AmpE [Denitrificimonas sp. JX-1]|uniref:Regulatory signaling modulator protein AmpE n=1 Tax=Denitrificimonas halotolerans TaxID=3098930 RepID=A0ABU5GU88_9GAMM|nr:regulatory signaling modulator protein AmpE [Denitrificimonas sp. JX-1]MDY7219826.1 regulatory signaling modulator protein AmpE [Denitrificimonas sp. JX-1]